jgi:hypothetical protein
MFQVNKVMKIFNLNQTIFLREIIRILRRFNMLVGTIGCLFALPPLNPPLYALLLNTA